VLDLTSMIGEILASPWLMPLLTLAVVADGPFPFLPSEPLLFSAAAAAAAAADAARITTLFTAALIGSLLGDLLLYSTGRSSNRVIRTTRRDDGIGAWVRRHLHRRPILALCAVRLIPGGRLASVTAAGRVQLPLQAFFPATLASSLLWTTYMTSVGLLIGPITGGDPLLSLLAGLISAAVISSLIGGARRIMRLRDERPRPRAGSNHAVEHMRGHSGQYYNR
jgi:membrane-associated protein